MSKAPESPQDSFNEAVPLGFAKALLLQARAFGKDTAVMLQQADFPFDPLDENQEPTYISMQQYSRLCQQLFEAVDDESGGVLAGVRTPLGTTRLIAYSIIHCANLRAALERAMEFNACCREPRGSDVSNGLIIDEQRKLATLYYRSTPPAGVVAPAQDGVLCSLSMWLRFCGWLVGQHIDLVSASCAGPEPDNTGSIRHFFHCPVSFDADTNSVTFSLRHLDAELQRTEQQLEEFLKVAPYHVVIKPVTSDSSITTRIRELLGSDFRQELPTFERLTGLLNMSARTLRRRLEKEGTSYQRIKDNVRRDEAINLLSKERMTVSDVAEQVGFSDPSAFHRSFKKWTGQSPGAYH